jgi:membrane-associated phospholipid phosphatase
VSFQCSDKLGLSLELGSFAAGVMISTTDLAQHTLEQVLYSFAFGFRTCTILDDLCFINPHMEFCLLG